MRRITAVHLIGALILACVGSADVYVRPPTARDLAQVWVGGVTAAPGEYFRVELAEDGTGLLTVLYLPDQPAVAYRVMGTKLAKYVVSFELAPVDREAEPIYLRGTATPFSMELDVGNKAQGWERRIYLERYSDVMARIRAVTERADAYRSQVRE